MTKIVGLAREGISPENPTGSETRVAMLPEQVKQVIDAQKKAGTPVDFIVEKGAGERIGASDADYKAAGARIVDTDTLYKTSDMVIKLKAPADEHLRQMKRGSTLFCMLHLTDMPHRKNLLDMVGVDAVSMEEVRYSPDRVTEEYASGFMAVKDKIAELAQGNTASEQQYLCFIRGTDRAAAGAVRAAAEHNFDGITVLAEDCTVEDIRTELSHHAGWQDKPILLIDHNPPIADTQQLGKQLVTVNLDEADKTHCLQRYRKQVGIPKIGERMIQNLGMTGEGGVQLAMDKLETLGKSVNESEPMILGSGHVAMGAINFLLKQKAHAIQVLGRHQTVEGRIEPFLNNSYMVINGACPDPGVFLIKNKHLKDGTLRQGTVISDLVSGTPDDRSAVEPAESFTTPDNPWREHDGVHIASVWGLPLCARDGAKRSTAQYSKQITEVLTGEIGLINGIDSSKPQLTHALYLGSQQTSPPAIGEVKDVDKADDKCEALAL